MISYLGITTKLLEEFMKWDITQFPPSKFFNAYVSKACFKLHLWIDKIYTSWVFTDTKHQGTRIRGSIHYFSRGSDLELFYHQISSPRRTLVDKQERDTLSIKQLTIPFWTEYYIKRDIYSHFYNASTQWNQLMSCVKFMRESLRTIWEEKHQRIKLYTKDIIDHTLGKMPKNS